jgi:hypothetical protein
MTVPMRLAETGDALRRLANGSSSVAPRDTGREAIRIAATCLEREVVTVAESPGDTAELRCGKCGYGIMVSGEPPACPMCRSFAWQTADAGPASSWIGRPAGSG